jgi:hypothetical protein
VPWLGLGAAARTVRSMPSLRVTAAAGTTSSFAVVKNVCGYSSDVLNTFMWLQRRNFIYFLYIYQSFVKTLIQTPYVEVPSVCLSVLPSVHP